MSRLQSYKCCKLLSTPTTGAKLRLKDSVCMRKTAVRQYCLVKAGLSRSILGDCCRFSRSAVIKSTAEATDRRMRGTSNIFSWGEVWQQQSKNLLLNGASSY